MRQQRPKRLQTVIASHRTFAPRSLYVGRGLFIMNDQTGGVNAPTECLSSNATLFWRVFIPIFGTVFLSGLLLTFLLIPEEDLYLSFPIIWGRVTIFTIWVGWFLLVRSTIWRLKRVDANATHLFVTNYWTTVRYPWSDVERIEEKRHLGRRLIHLHLRAAGRFGKKISFLPGSHFEEWKRENLEV